MTSNVLNFPDVSIFLFVANIISHRMKEKKIKDSGLAENGTLGCATSLAPSKTGQTASTILSKGINTCL